jgi:protein-disulfide isomerase
MRLAFLLPLLLSLPVVLPAQEVKTVTPAGVKEILSEPVMRMGPKNADVIVVEYFDYNCPFCKKLVPELRALLAQDRKIALVYKDWPILGEMSVHAARDAVAAQWQGKYLLAHDALLAGPRLTSEGQIDDLLRSAGVNIDTLKRDLDAHRAELDAWFERIDVETRALGLQGTPGIMVGRQFVGGIAGVEDLKKLVAAARQAP